MKFDANLLKKFLKPFPSKKKIKDALTMHIFETEIEGDVFEVDILPNRFPDASSHWGLAREISAILNLSHKDPETKFFCDREKIEKKVKAKVLEKRLCPRYTLTLVENVKVKESPLWLQRHLKKVGIEPINNVVDLTNYVMIELGQPMHAFDFDKIEGEIIVRRAKKGEEIETLDDKKYLLDENVLLIADKKGPLALAGIKGGKRAQIEKETKNVLIEAAIFDRENIYLSSKKLKIESDAAKRFSYGIPFDLPILAQKRILHLFEETFGKGIKIKKGIIDIKEKKKTSQIIFLNVDHVEKLLGKDFSKKEIETILKRLGFKIKSKSKKILKIETPWWRIDIEREVDLIEEIGRIFGYERIEAKMPTLPLSLPKRNEILFWQKKAKNFFVGLGFDEIQSYSFLSENDAKILKKNLLEVLNPTSKETKYLRNTLSISLIKALKKNENIFSKIKIFEIGKVYFDDLSEKWKLGGMVSGKDKFLEVKGIVEALFECFGISDYFFDDYEIKEDFPIFEKGRSAEIKVSQKRIGIVGEISSQILDFYGIKKEGALFEIDFEKLVKLTEEEHEYKQPSPYPEAIKDISLIVPKETKVVEVMNVIYSAGGEILRDVDLFDIYEGGGVEENKKSLAFHLIFHSKKEPLSDKKVKDVFDKVIKTLNQNPFWKVRKI